MGHQIFKWLARLQKFVGRWWYVPLVAFFAAADSFVVIFPIEALLIARILTRRKRWGWAVFWIATGSALGALILATLVESNRHMLNNALLHHLTTSRDWARVTQWVQNDGVVGIGLVSFSPIPQHPAVIIGALAEIPLFSIFLAVWVARLVKYAIFGALSAYAPGLLMRVPPIRKAIEELDPRFGSPLELTPGKKRRL